MWMYFTISMLFLLIFSIYRLFIYEPKMRKLYPNFNSKNLNYSNLVPINFACKGLYYRTKSEQFYAGLLKVGDYLYIEKEPNNPKTQYAINILGDNGTHIGYMEDFFARYCFENFEKIKACRITKITQGPAVPYIYAEVYLTSDLLK